MGHGDDLVLVDRNFPAIQVAKQTSTGRLIELPGLNIPQATRAGLSTNNAVFPYLSQRAGH